MTPSWSDFLILFRIVLLVFNLGILHLCTSEIGLQIVCDVFHRIPEDSGLIRDTYHTCPHNTKEKMFNNFVRNFFLLHFGKFNQEKYHSFISV